ncbi:MAG: hypothetical protein ACYC2R_13370 [Burkholderiales bacterium]
MDNLPDKRTQEITREITSLRARTKFPLSTKAEAKLEAFGLPAVCALILDGLTLSEIAQRVGVQRCEVSAWHLNLADPMFEASMKASAETCLEMAEQALHLKAEDCTMPMVQLARERAAIWRHRASVRDARYSPKAAVDFSPPAEPMRIPNFVIQVLPSTTRHEELVESSPDPD